MKKNAVFCGVIVQLQDMRYNSFMGVYMKNRLKKAFLLVCILCLCAPLAACTDAGSSIDVTFTPFPGETLQTGAPSLTIAPALTFDPDNPNNYDSEHPDNKTPEPTYSYEEYRERNHDVIGWIKIDDTVVDYPIVQSDDNSYYLTRNPLKQSSKAGAIFLDYRCDARSGKHNILFGHNMTVSGTMFAQVNNYSLRSFYDNHRTFTVTFGDNTHTYKVFSVYATHVDNAQYMTVDFDSGEQFAQYMNMLASLSQFPVDTEITPDDRVITLSTCNHINYSDGRFVVHAVRTD